MGSTARSIRLLGASLLATAGAQATGLTLEPGLWEASWTISNALTGQQFTETRTQCIRTREFNPRELLRQAQGCRVVSEDQQGNRIQFSLICSLEGGAQTQVDGNFETDGSNGNGQLRTQTRIGGMSVNMDTNVSTRRIGDCPAAQS